MLFYQAGSSTLTSGQNGNPLDGTTFLPNGQVSFTANNSGTGFVEANPVSISKNNFGITGNGPPVASNGCALLQ